MLYNVYIYVLYVCYIYVVYCLYVCCMYALTHVRHFRMLDIISLGVFFGERKIILG